VQWNGMEKEQWKTEWKKSNGNRNGIGNGMERAMELVLSEAYIDQQRKYNSCSFTTR
jgi:hypothetical protein